MKEDIRDKLIALVEEGNYNNDAIRMLDRKQFADLVEDRFPEALDLATKYPKKLLDEQSVKKFEEDEDLEYVRSLYSWKYHVTNYTKKEMKQKNISKAQNDKKRKGFQDFIGELLLEISILDLENKVLVFSTGPLLEEIKRISEVQDIAIKIETEKKELIDKRYEEYKKEKNRRTEVDVLEVIHTEIPKESSASTYINSIKKKDRNYFYSIDFVDTFWDNEISIKWIEWYIDVLCTDRPKNYDDLVSEMALHEFSGIGTKQRSEVLANITVDKIESVLAKTKKMGILDDIIDDLWSADPNTKKRELILQFLMEQNEIQSLIKILQAEDFPGGYKLFVKAKLNEILYNINYNNTVELKAILTALSLLNEDDTWLKDISFWKYVRKEAFQEIVNWLQENGNFFEIAYINMKIAKVANENTLLSMWVDSFVRIGISIDDNDAFQDVYRQIQRDPVLGERFIAKINSMIFDEAINYKRAYIAEKRRVEANERRLFEKILNSISENIGDIEGFLCNRSYEDMPISQYREVLVHDIAELRRSMRKCMVDTVIDPDLWEKGDNIRFNPAVHISDDELNEGDIVVPLSMGMSVNNGNYIEHGKVKKVNEEA